MKCPPNCILHYLPENQLIVEVCKHVAQQMLHLFELQQFKILLAPIAWAHARIGADDKTPVVLQFDNDFRRKALHTVVEVRIHLF